MVKYPPLIEAEVCKKQFGNSTSLAHSIYSQPVDVGILCHKKSKRREWYIDLHRLLDGVSYT